MSSSTSDTYLMEEIYLLPRQRVDECSVSSVSVDRDVLDALNFKIFL